MPDWNNKIRLNSNIIKKDNKEEAVLLDLDGEIYHGLNATGVKMLESCLEADSVDDALKKLMDTYEVEESRIKSDLSSLLDSLTEKNIIEWIKK